MFKALSDLFNDPAGDPIEITVFEALGVWLGLMGLGCSGRQSGFFRDMEI